MPIPEEKTAVLSPCGLYRYRLTRGDRGGKTACWIMLNPSTADADLDDPTIRRVVGFTAGFGCSLAVVVNLFAFRATDPYDMRDARDPIGPDNDHAIIEAANSADLVICAWGVHGVFYDRDLMVMSMLSRHDIKTVSLGVTKDGHPRHPLYVRSDQLLVRYEPRHP